MSGTKRKYSPAWTKTAAASKRRKTSSVVSVPRSLPVGENIISRRQRCRLKYHAKKALNTTTFLGNGTYFVRCSANGMFDPDLELGGHQPRGFDQLASIYDQYQVRECIIEAYFSSNVGTAVYRPFIAIRPSTSELPDATNIFEGPDRVVSTKVISGQGENGADSTYLRMKVDPIKWLGNRGLDNENTQANVVTNPSDQVVWYVGAINPHLFKASPWILTSS